MVEGDKKRRKKYWQTNMQTGRHTDWQTQTVQSTIAANLTKSNKIHFEYYFQNVSTFNKKELPSFECRNHQPYRYCLSKTSPFLWGTGMAQGWDDVGFQIEGQSFNVTINIHNRFRYENMVNPLNTDDVNQRHIQYDQNTDVFRSCYTLDSRWK